jgi:hypothetical protein
VSKQIPAMKDGCWSTSDTVVRSGRTVSTRASVIGPRIGTDWSFGRGQARGWEAPADSVTPADARRSFGI